MTLRLYNTLAREKQDFVPQDPSRVTLYVCGPTVYNRAHIGNFRPVIIFDTLFRVLRTLYGEDHVLFARNITDIEDKIIAAAKDANVPISEITTKYADIYNADSRAVNALPPSLEPRATDHVEGMIEIIEKLIHKNYAYVGKQGVWFSVSAMSDYGKLSGRKLDDNEAGARVAVDDDKRDAADFALWKFAKADEPEDAIWDSPWGRGRPGWHIECSAMAAAHLGKTIDIHAGGIDLQFPHHENEIAQSECAHGVQMANYWMHNGFLDMSGEKMSKSLGNVVLLNDLLKDWHGEVIRFAMLSGHYRAPLDWTPELIQQAKTTLDRIYGALRRVWDATDGEARDKGVLKSLRDDLNTPVALAHLSRIATDANTAVDQKDAVSMANGRANLLAAGKLLGILTLTPTEWERGDDDDDAARIDALVQGRIDARAAKDWAEADRIRDALADEGIEVMDNPGGSTWRKI